MIFDKSEDYYYPTIFFNEFWLMREHLYPINDTTQELPLHLSYSTISLWKWQMMIQMEQSFKMQESMGAVESEKDEVKVTLLLLPSPRNNDSTPKNNTHSQHRGCLSKQTHTCWGSLS